MNEQDHHTSTTGGPIPGPRKRRRYPWIVLGLLLVIAAAVAAAPSLLSTPPIRNAALSWYNQSIAGHVSVEDVSLSWFGGQAVRAVEVKDPQGATVLTLGELTTDLTLADALRGRLPLGRTRVSGLNMDLRFADDGTNNLGRALAGEAPAAGEAGRPAVPVTGNMTLEDARVSITAPGIDPVVLEELSGGVDMTGPESPVRLAFSGRTRQGDLQGSIEIDGRIDDLFSNGELSPESATATVDGRVQDLPMDALDQVLGLRGLLTAALGDRTSLTVKADGGADRQNLAIDAEAPNGRLHLEGSIAEQSFRLQNPATARLEITPGLVDTLNGLSAGTPGTRLAASVPLHLDIKRLDVPLEDFTAGRIALESTLTADGPVRLTGIEQVGDMSINDLRLQVATAKLADGIHLSLTGKPVTGGRTGDLTLRADARNLVDEQGNLQPGKASLEAQSSIAGIPTTLVDTALQQEGLLVDVAGDTLDLELDAGTDAEGRVNVSLNLASERLQAGPVQLLVDEHLALAQPTQVRLTVTPPLGRRLLGEDAAYRLAGTSQWTLDLKTLRVPLPTDRSPAFDPGATRLDAAVSTPAVALTESGTSRPTRLENLRVDVGAGKGLGDISFNGAVDVLQPGGTLESLDASPLHAVLEGGTGLNDDASIKKITSVLTLSGEGVNARLNTVVEAGLSRLALTEPAPFDLQLTPRLVAQWQDSAAPAVTLTRKARLQGRLESLSLPLSPFSFAGLQASGSAGLGGDGAEPVGLQSAGGVVTQFDDTRLTFEFAGSDGGRGRLDLNAGVRSNDGETGKVTLEAAASNILNADATPAADAMTLELNGKLQQLPVALVDQILNMEGTASATLGPTADVELSSRLERMQGPLTISLSAPNAQADVRARLGDRGLTLSEPLVAQVNPTPEFGSKVLANVHPIFETTQRAEQPIRFEMPAKGVLIPIEHYAFERITVPAMTLDFGKLVLKSGWLLRGVVGLGQQFGKLESVQKDEWIAWFTPGVMEIRDGRILYSRRLDVLLAEKLHLATWGSADVGRDRSDLTLAFMPDTMERVFSITVAANDALHVPITGPLSSPSIDFKKAGADLARLRAQEEVSGENPLAGALLGAVTGKTTGGGGPVPPPSVTPLPWAEQLKALDAAEARQEQTRAQEPSQTPQQTDQPAPGKEPSTEEKVIKGLIDIFGKQKKE